MNCQRWPYDSKAAFSVQITVTYKSFLGVHLRKPLSRKVQRRWRCTLTVHVCTAEEEYDAVAGGARRPLPTLMFAHGMGGCKDEAEPFVVGLCGHGVAVVSIDQPVRPTTTCALYHTVAVRCSTAWCTHKHKTVFAVNICTHARS